MNQECDAFYPTIPSHVHQVVDPSILYQERLPAELLPVVKPIEYPICKDPADDSRRNALGTLVRSTCDLQ
jgi:hypothetical protein